MYEDIRRTLIFYFDYKEAKLNYKQDILNNVDQTATETIGIRTLDPSVKI